MSTIRARLRALEQITPLHGPQVVFVSWLGEGEGTAAAEQAVRWANDVQRIPGESLQAFKARASELITKRGNRQVHTIFLGTGTGSPTGMPL